MALVAYDSSECSESEDEEEDHQLAPVAINLDGHKQEVTDEYKNVSMLKKSAEEYAGVGQIDRDIEVPKSSLFSSLPVPKKSTTRLVNVLPEEEEDDFLQVGAAAQKHLDGDVKGKEPSKVKITIPALPQFDDDDDEPVNKKHHVSSGKGLFSLLPPPKHQTAKVTNRPLIPYSLGKKKAEIAKQTSKKTTATVESSSVAGSKPAATDNYESDDDGDDHDTDFFSLDKVGKTVNLDPTIQEGDNVMAEPPLLDSMPTSSAYCDVPLQFRDDWTASASSSTTRIEHLETDANGQKSPDNIGMLDGQISGVEQPQTETNINSLFTDEGFMRLHGKKRGREEDIQFIDVSQDDQLPKTEEWLTKILTQESEYRPSRKKGFMPTAQQRRKHQITYLAFQAKERELELKNQWSQNRFTKRQTQSKYGF